jgi:hypothetical protein
MIADRQTGCGSRGDGATSGLITDFIIRKTGAPFEGDGESFSIRAKNHLNKLYLNINMLSFHSGEGADGGGYA